MIGSQGWICPNCNKSMAPWMPFCDCVNRQTTGTSNGTGGVKIKCHFCGELYSQFPFYAHVCNALDKYNI